MMNIKLNYYHKRIVFDLHTAYSIESISGQGCGYGSIEGINPKFSHTYGHGTGPLSGSGSQSGDSHGHGYGALVDPGL